jgi:hypothetical protein
LRPPTGQFKRHGHVKLASRPAETFTKRGVLRQAVVTILFLVILTLDPLPTFVSMTCFLKHLNRNLHADRFLKSSFHNIGGSSTQKSWAVQKGRRDPPVEAWLEGLVLAEVAHHLEEERVARAQGARH